MSARTTVLVCVTASWTGLCVAQQRVGLALTVALLLVLAVGRCVTFASRGDANATHLALGIALALVPTVRDAGWVVAAATAGALIAAALVATPAAGWVAVRDALTAPLRAVAGTVVAARAVRALLPDGRGAHAGAVARGIALASLLLLTFGALFASADEAFAELTSDALDPQLDAGDVTVRVALAAVAFGLCGALAVRRPLGPSTRPRWSPGTLEWRIALGALVALFAAFVAVQLTVLFGGEAYVQRTTGLGYGDYARKGFVQLLAVAALTLAVIAAAARRRDGVTTVLLGALCVLTLVVLVSAHHRLVLVEDAYGLTRVRYGGHAVVLWLAAVFAAVLLAGVARRTAPHLPRTLTLLSLGAVVVLAATDPDRRIAAAQLARDEPDLGYVAQLSADALPVARGTGAAARLRQDLRRADGPLGLNVSRARAR